MISRAPVSRDLRMLQVTLGAVGATSVLAGILVLVWPGKSAAVGTALVAVYAIIAGLVLAGVGIFAPFQSGWARFARIALGVLYVVAGFVAFAHIPDATVFLAVTVAVLVGITWIADGVTDLVTLSQQPGEGRGWSVVSAVISIVGGATMLFAPLIGASVLWVFLGVSLLVIGGAQIARALTLGRA